MGRRSPGLNVKEPDIICEHAAAPLDAGLNGVSELFWTDGGENSGRHRASPQPYGASHQNLQEF